MIISCLRVSWKIFIKIIYIYGIIIPFYLILASTNINNSTINRLSDNFIPIHYEINLIPYIEKDNFTYDGESYIDIQAKSESNILILNVYKLQIKGIITLKNNNKKYESDIYEIDNKNEFLIIQFHEKISKGNYTLHIKYCGVIDQLQGIIRNNYTDTFGQRQWLVASHFEPNYARRAFPCWDEPAFKATFKISIKHHRRYIALSNTRFNSICSTNDSNNYVWTHFEKTPVMSTYHIAFIVGDLDYLTHSEDDTFRIWTKKNSINRGETLLIYGFKALKLLENFTGISYQNHGLKKIDLVMLPDLLPVGSENWGIIILKENEFLFKENNISKQIKKDNFIFLTHELSHQWFGNLVTQEWWRFLWLKEGLATYFSYFINNQLEKSWRIMDKYVLELRNKIFIHDANSMSFMNADTNLNELWSYDGIYNNYLKGGFIIKMINYILGEENFRIGIKNFLNNNKFGVVTSNNLFEEFIKVSGNINVSLEKALNNWESTPGYPIITINRNYTFNRATITQSRFLLYSNVNTTDRYWIPMNFVTQDNIDFDNSIITHWFDPNSISLEISTSQSDKWLISNKQQFGYYRVNYDEKNWQLIINYLKSENYYKIHYLNRAQLIDDVFTLAEGDFISFSIAFELMEYIKHEKDSLPWVTFLKKLSNLYKSTSLSQSSYDKTFKKIVLFLFENVEKNIFINETTDKNLIEEIQKKLIIKWACAFGSTLCNNYTFSKMTKWLENSEKNPIPVELRTEIICGGIRHADKNIWNEVLKKYLKNQDKNILKALITCTTNVELLNNILFLAINKTFNEYDEFKFFLEITSTANGLEAIFNFIDYYETKFRKGRQRKFLFNGIQFIRHNVKSTKNFSKWQELLKKFPKHTNAKIYSEEVAHTVNNYNLQLKNMENYFKKRAE